MADEANGNEILNGNHMNGDHEELDEIAAMKARVSVEFPEDIVMTDSTDNAEVIEAKNDDEEENVEEEQEVDGSPDMHSNDEVNVEVIDGDEGTVNEETESSRRSLIEQDTESNRESFIQIPEDDDSNETPDQCATDEDQQQQIDSPEDNFDDRFVETYHHQHIPEELDVVQEEDIPEQETEIDLVSPYAEDQDDVDHSRPQSFIEIEQTDQHELEEVVEEDEEEEQIEDAQSPLEELTEPVDEVQYDDQDECVQEEDAAEEAQIPAGENEEDEVAEPEEEVQSPVEDVQSPVEEVQSPVEEPYSPVERPASPTGEYHEETDSVNVAEEETEEEARKRISQYIDFEPEDQNQVETVTTSQRIEIRSREGSLDNLDDEQAEDKIEDDRDALPNLRNIKSRFENVDENKPQVDRPAPGKLKYTWSADAARNKEVSPSPPRDPEIVREEKSKEQVPITTGGLGNIKQQYMASTKKAPASPGLDPLQISAGGISNIKQQYMQSVAKPASSGGPPRPIEIPRQEFNRNEPSPSPQRDPNVIRSEDVPDEGQYMPAPQTTRGLVARFKQMEVENAGQASPARRAPMPNTVHVQRKPAGSTPEPRVDLLESERQIPDSGEFSNNPVYRDDVITEYDELPEQELPEAGAAKSRINMFRQKERETAQKPPPNFGDLYAPGRMVNGDQNQKRLISSSDRPVNNPPDVVRHEETGPDDLPPQDLTKSMLSKFRQLETDAQDKKEQEYSPKRNSVDKPRRSIPRENHSDNDVVDRPLFNPANPEGGEFENQPLDLPDVVRESDPFDENELPEVGVTRNLLAKFQQMQT